MKQGVPVYVRIQRHIRDGIACGAYGAGSRIPSEPELAQTFSTTRATVARALQELVFDGTIVRRAGQGSFVAAGAYGARAVPLESRRLRSFEEQMDERGEAVAYRLVGFALKAAPRAVSARLGCDAAWNLERVRLVRGAALSFESRFIPEDIAVRIPPAWLEGQSIHRILEAGLGLNIARIEASVQVGAASARIARLLALPRGRPLLVREHRLVGAGERVLLAGASFYTAAFRLDYTVRRGD